MFLSATSHSGSCAPRHGRGPRAVDASRCQESRFDGDHCQILPAIQMLMCAAALQATNRDATKRCAGGQPAEHVSGNIFCDVPTPDGEPGVVRRTPDYTTCSPRAATLAPKMSAGRVAPRGLWQVYAPPGRLATPCRARC